jgi:hypothetical protein
MDSGSVRRGFVVAGAFALLACHVERAAERVPHLFRFEGRTLERMFPTPQTLSRVDRDSRGDRLFLFPLGEPGSPVVILRADGSSATKRLPGYVAFLGDNEQFVAWSEGRTAADFRFSSGAIVRRRELLQPDYGGLYYFNASRDGTDIARCATPDVVLARSDLFAHKLFRRNGSLFLCGSVGASRSWACDVFAEDGPLLTKRRRIALGLLVVLDLDPFSGRLLVARVRDDPFPSQWFVFDPNTGTKEAVGKASDFGLFLSVGAR